MHFLTLYMVILWLPALQRGRSGDLRVLPARELRLDGLQRVRPEDLRTPQELRRSCCGRTLHGASDPRGVENYTTVSSHVHCYKWCIDTVTLGQMAYNYNYLCKYSFEISWRARQRCRCFRAVSPSLLPSPPAVAWNRVSAQ